MWFSFLTVNPKKPHNHLVEATAYFANIFSFAVILVMYVPSRRLDSIETNEYFNFVANDKWLVWDLIGPVIGAFVGGVTVTAFGWLYIGRTLETDVVALWLSYLWIVLLLFQLRSLRFARVGKIESMPRRATDADFSELLSAFGAASSMIGLIATVWASGLWVKFIQLLNG
jgi:hypothetical protein